MTRYAYIYIILYEGGTKIKKKNKKKREKKCNKKFQPVVSDLVVVGGLSY